MANIENIADDTVRVAAKPKSRYSLVVLAAKRARQLRDGAPPLIEPTSPNLLTTALQEIAAGKIGIIEAAEEPDDETPRYVRGGFIVSDYEDIINDTDSSSSDLSLDEELDGQDVSGDTETSTGTTEAERPTEE